MTEAQNLAAGSRNLIGSFVENPNLNSTDARGVQSLKDSGRDVLNGFNLILGATRDVLAFRADDGRGQ